MNRSPSPSPSPPAPASPDPTRRPAAPDRTPAPSESQPARPPRRLTSEELLRGAEEVLIEHETSTYRLRRTHQGKLILTK